ncbi:hypothetical protein [Photobacterium toruni]|uniref:Uncharacterized protein n=1 Tax=Photobacterium toruni TaxID=1935446 RepID=A0ABU6L3P8_9GAMM|nr:hypothetical protein [Photobacterium toruni]MEC6815212.1 hypothetical protein [Photobacterium toruni]MEC6830926.1 hypothetical protein [Photobacterium toruni]
MLSVVLRIMLLVLCLGASSFASASPQPNIMHFTSTSPVYTDVIEAPVLNINIMNTTTVTTDIASHTVQPFTHQHKTEQAPRQKHPTDRYVSNNGLPVSFYGTRLVWNFPSPTNIKLPLHSGKHHRAEVINLSNMINISTRSLNSFYHSADEIAPTFELAFELPLLPIPMLAIGYAEPLSPQTDWILTIKSSASRVSGWKESNLLYSHYGHSFVTA